MFGKFMFLALILSSTLTYSAEDAENKIANAEAYMNLHTEANASAAKYFSKKTLEEAYNQNFSVEEHSKSFNKMISKISKEVAQKLATGTASMDPDMCTSHCAQYGTSEIRMKLFFEVSTKIDLSKETRECQNVCKIYYTGYYGYLDGFQAARSDKNPGSTDCSGATTSTPRSPKPALGNDLDKIENAIKSGSGK